MKQLLKDANLYEYQDPFTGDVLTRDRKSLRPTGITLRLDKVEIFPTETLLTGHERVRA
jgi:hypothetical protein